MKNALIWLCIALAGLSCQRQSTVSSLDPINWSQRYAPLPLADSLIGGTTYLSVYSQIYSESEHRTHDLTVTASMRNVHHRDTVYIERADYYDTHGQRIRTYFERPIVIAPLETVEIIIDQQDRTGGTGANFLFDWRTTPRGIAPHFEAVMISTSGQQGISFTTQGLRIR